MPNVQIEQPFSVGTRLFSIVSVSASDVAEAKAIRASRDRLYGNIFVERASDQRWVGDLGELCFDFWLAEKGIAHGWLREDSKAAGTADFQIGDQLVGAKTVKRTVPVRQNYTAQITEQHSTEPVDHFFFMSYEFPKSRMWLLGGCTRQFFLEHSVLYEEGSNVHSNYRIRYGHAIRNIDIWYLDQPDEWLQKLSRNFIA